ncbi:ester cyclase [Streptomyces pactum]|uniref:Ester cyclase n=1 Tax=Streptomyces pactum TaxID=68249 RepID=A0ABS0NT65_9ACTN|nr:ester cyclase family protein [Streptomyces pactum]MBH5338399.1 ester cyclase [Streptomyces pactum]
MNDDNRPCEEPATEGRKKGRTLRRLLVVGVIGALLAVLTSGSAGAADDSRAAAHGLGTDTRGEQSKRVVLGFYREVLAEQRLDRVREFMREDYVQHSPGLKSGVDGYLEDYKLFHSVFPDLAGTIHQVVAQGDKVMLLATFKGHHAGTGKELVFETAELYRVQDGKIAEHWDAVDYAAMQEFGVNLPGGDQPATRSDWRGTKEQRRNLVTLLYAINTFYRQPQAPVPSAIAPDLVQHQRGLEPGLDGLRDNLRSYRERFPDLTFEIKHTVASQDKAVVFWVWRGHEKGTGKELALNRADLFRVERGRFVEHWSRLDYRAVNPFGLK